MRGGLGSLRTATPGFMEMVRWAMYVERAMPIYRYWRGVEAAPFDPTHPDRHLIAEKSKAREVLPALTELLFPEDAGG